MRIRTPLGLGDAIYCWPIIQYFSERMGVEVMTRYPIIYDNLPVSCVPYDKNFHLSLHYNKRRSKPTDQYTDILKQCDLPMIPFQFDFNYPCSDKIWNVLDQGKKICVVKEPCKAHMHKNKEGVSVDPDPKEMQKYINKRKDEYFFISVGKAEKFKDRLDIDLDLTDKTSIPDLIQIIKASSLVLTQIGHLVPLAIAFRIDHKIFMPAEYTPFNENLIRKFM